MAASDARPVPRKNVAYRLYVTIRKSDGTLITSWTGADTELSLDGGSFADATNELTEIGTSGVGYLELTAGEMNYDAVVIKSTVTNTGALPLVITLFPEEASDYRADVTHFGGSAGTFSGGRAEVNTSHWGGTAIASAVVSANAIQISGDSTAADNLELFFDGTGYAAANSTIGTVTTLTNGVTVTTNNDKTGYSLTATTGLGNQTANITGNLSGSVGSVTAGVTVTTNNDKSNYTIASGGITAASIATGAIDADSLAADAVTAIAQGVFNYDLSGSAIANTFGSYTKNIHTDTDTIIATIGSAGAGLTEAGGTGDHLTAIPWNASWDAEVQSEVQDAIEVNNLDHLLKVAAVAGDVVDSSVVARLTSKSATPAFTSFNNTTDSLEAIRDRGDAAWTTGGGGGGGTSPQLLQNTTIATLTSQTVFTLDAGSSDNDAYNGAIIIVTDQSTSEQKAFGIVSDYVGSTKTVTLDAALEFTIAVGDTVDILATGGNNITISPIAGNAPDRVEQTTIKAFVGEDWSEPISGVDADGNAINFNSLGTLQFSVTDARKTELLVIADASITTTSTTFTVTIPASLLTYGTVLNWSLRDLTDGNKVIMYGPIEVIYAADDDGV